jgi:hypothetical protein
MTETTPSFPWRSFVQADAAGMTPAMPGRAAGAHAAAVARAYRPGTSYLSTTRNTARVASEPSPIGLWSSISTIRLSENTGSGTLSRGRRPLPHSCSAAPSPIMGPSSPDRTPRPAPRTTPSGRPIAVSGSGIKLGILRPSSNASHSGSERFITQTRRGAIPDVLPENHGEARSAATKSSPRHLYRGSQGTWDRPCARRQQIRYVLDTKAPIEVGPRVAAVPPHAGPFGSGGRIKAMHFFAIATE